MTVAELTSPKRWWERIPKSWLAAEGETPRQYGENRGYRDRDRDREMDLDDTRSFRRRYEDQPPPQQLHPKVQVPFGVIVTITIYLVGQLVAGIWWAATLQSNLQHEISDRAKEEQRLWDGIQAYRSEVNALRLDVARATGNPNRRMTQKEEEE